MFVKNEIGEFVNLDKVVAMRITKYGTAVPKRDDAYDQRRDTAVPSIALYAPKRVLFCFKSKESYQCAFNKLSRLLLEANNTWVHAGEYMFRADKIRSVYVTGWVITVHLDGCENHFEILTHSDTELEFVQNTIEQSLRSENMLANLYE